MRDTTHATAPSVRGNCCVWPLARIKGVAFLCRLKVKAADSNCARYSACNGANKDKFEQRWAVGVFRVCERLRVCQAALEAVKVYSSSGAHPKPIGELKPFANAASLFKFLCLFKLHAEVVAEGRLPASRRGFRSARLLQEASSATWLRVSPCHAVRSIRMSDRRDGGFGRDEQRDERKRREADWHGEQRHGSGAVLPEMMANVRLSQRAYSPT